MQNHLEISSKNNFESEACKIRPKVRNRTCPGGRGAVGGRSAAVGGGRQAVGGPTMTHRVQVADKAVKLLS